MTERAEQVSPVRFPRAARLSLFTFADCVDTRSGYQPADAWLETPSWTTATHLYPPTGDRSAAECQGCVEHRQWSKTWTALRPCAGQAVQWMSECLNMQVRTVTFHCSTHFEIFLEHLSSFAEVCFLWHDPMSDRVLDFLPQSNPVCRPDKSVCDGWPA